MKVYRVLYRCADGNVYRLGITTNKHDFLRCSGWLRYFKLYKSRFVFEAVL